MRRSTHILKWTGIGLLACAAILATPSLLRLLDRPPAEGVFYDGRHVSEWIDELEDPLEDAPPIFGHVRTFLESPNPRRARRVLAIIGPQAVPLLERALFDSRESVRSGAAWVLGEIGPDAAPAVDALLDALPTFGDHRWRGQHALYEIGAAAHERLIDALADPDRAETAAYALANSEPAPKAAAPALLRCIREERALPAAAYALSRIRAEPSVEVPVLLDVLSRTDDPKQQNVILGAIGRYGADAAPALPAIVAATEADDMQVVFAALDAIRKIGPAAAAYARDLTWLLAHESPVVRQFTLAALLPMGPGAAGVLPTLLAFIERAPPGHSIGTACETIGRFASAAEPALATLERLLTNAPTRHAAARALARLCPHLPEAHAVLERALVQSDVETRRAVAGAFWEPATDMAFGGPLLVRALDDEDASVRQVAMGHLRVRAPQAAVPAVARLVAWLEVPRGRSQVALLLADIGPPAAAALPRLRELVAAPLTGKDAERFRGTVAGAIARIEADTARAAEDLLAYVRTHEGHAREAAVWHFEHVGALPPGVADALLELLPDLDPLWMGRTAVIRRLRREGVDPAALLPHVLPRLRAVVLQHDPAGRRVVGEDGPVATLLYDLAMADPERLLPLLEAETRDFQLPEAARYNVRRSITRIRRTLTDGVEPER